MQVGMMADITVFDPLRAKAESTYKAGEQGRPTSGIPYVIVSGRIVVKDSRFQKIWAGQPVRYPAEPKGRFESMTAEQWIERYSINVDAPPAEDFSMGPASAGARGVR